jgi:hypothetical protein
MIISVCLDFIKKLFHKQKEILAEKVELNNLIEFLKTKNSADIAEIEREAARYKDQTMTGFSDLRQMLDKMRNLRSNDPFTRASNEVKNSFCDRAILMITRGPNKEMGAHDFMASAKKVIDDINAISPRQAAHMQFFFRENLDEVARKMKTILSTIDDFREYMSTNIISDIENVQKEILSIRENEKRMLYFERNMDEIEKEMKELQSREQKSSSRAVDIDQNRLSKIKAEMTSLNKDKQNIFQEVDTEFTSLDKLMKKYSHDMAEKKEKILIEKYLESPSNSFFIYDKELQIRKVLESMKNAIEKKELETEDKKYVHLCSILKNMDHFRKLRKDYQSVMKGICDKESEIVREEKVFEKARRFHDDLNEIRNKISELGLMKKQLEESKARMREINEKKVRDIEFMISSGTGIEIKVIY